MAADKTNYTTNSEFQKTDPKLQEYEDKISSLKEKLNLYSAYVTAYSYNGKFDMKPVIALVYEGSGKVFEEAQNIRKNEEGGDGSTCTYVKVVRDPEPVLTAISPREFDISDVVYYQYTEGYNTEEKQKEKIKGKKTPKKIYTTVKRTLENDTVYKGLEEQWRSYCKIYANWLKYIDKYEDIQKEIESTNDKKEAYIKKKEQDAYNAKVKAENKATTKKEKAVNAVKNELRKYTAGPKSIVSYKNGGAYLRNFYLNLVSFIDANVFKTEENTFDEQLKPKAEEVIVASNKVVSEYSVAYDKNVDAEANYDEVKDISKQYDDICKPFIKEINDNKNEAVTKKKQEQAKAAQERKQEKASDKAKKKAEKKTLKDNIKPETTAQLEQADTNGKGTNDGAVGSTEATPKTGEDGTVDENGATKLVADRVTKEEEKEKEPPKQQEDKYTDEDKWTNENVSKIKSKKSSSTSSEEGEAAVSEVDMGMALANIAQNIVGAVLTDPSFAQTTNGMASTGTFDTQSLQGMGNAMLGSAQNVAMNAAMNALGVGAIEEMADDVLTATNTILVTATNIVPMIKDLTIATVTTVTDELTSHVVEKVEGILDPTPITSQIQYYTSYYTKLYTKSADDLKTELLNPGDQAMEQQQEETSEQAKNDKMKNMTQKLADLKNKVQDGIAMAKGGINMVTTYINNGPDWVIKQLNSYTEFAIAQTEKYIDFGADYVIDQRDMWIAQTGEAIGKRIADKANKKLEQATKKALDYIEVKKKYATQVAMASLMTAVQVIVGKLGPMIGMTMKAGVKLGMKQLLKTIGG